MVISKKKKDKILGANVPDLRENRWKPFWAKALSYLVFVVLGVGTIFYHFIESWSWLDSLYFSVSQNLLPK